VAGSVPLSLAEVTEKLTGVHVDTTPENYRETWKPDMTPEEGHAWAEAAGTTIPQTVVHMTEMSNVDGIKGTGFNPAQQSMHEYGRYFAIDPDTAEFYSYKGNTAVSTVVVAQNPLTLDWRESENISDSARAGEFQEAALEAAGFAAGITYGEADSELRANGFIPEDYGHEPDDYIEHDAIATTALLKSAGYDSVSIFAHSGGNEDPTTGGDQLIVFDREQAVVIGTEEVPNAFNDHEEWRAYYSEEDQALLPKQPEQTASRFEWERFWDEVDAFQQAHPNPSATALARAFAKDFTPSLHPRNPDGTFRHAAGGLGEIHAGSTDEGANGTVKVAKMLIDIMDRDPDQQKTAAELKQANVVHNGTALAMQANIRKEIDGDSEMYDQLERLGNRVAPDPITTNNAAYLHEWLGVQIGEKLSKAELGARELAAKLQDTWMSSSSDTSPMSWGAQLAVANHLGVDTALESLRQADSVGGPGWTHSGSLVADLGIEPVRDQNSLEQSAQQYADSPAVKAYVELVYNETQASLKKQGVTELMLYRGVHFDPASTGVGDPLESPQAESDQDIILNPVSSFSTSEMVAEAFAQPEGFAHSYVLEATVPVERVFSMATTGPGCLKETELLVVGGPAQATVTWLNPEPEYGWGSEAPQYDPTSGMVHPDWGNI
jgi:hypothetical protein